MNNTASYITNLVSKQGNQWQVLKWNEDEHEWLQVGPYYDSESEALDAIDKLRSAAH